MLYLLFVTLCSFFFLVLPSICFNLPFFFYMTFIYLADTFIHEGGYNLSISINYSNHQEVLYIVNIFFFFPPPPF